MTVVVLNERPPCDPSSPYDVVVVAFNVEGQSEAVPAMTTAWTGEGIPEVAPEEFVCGVNVAETTPTTTLCTWAKYREEVKTYRSFAACIKAAT